MKQTRKIGNWKGVRKALTGIRRVCRAHGGYLLQKIAIEGERQAVMYIRDQKGDWKPLNAAYRAAKRGRGESGKTLIRSGQYLQSITHTAKPKMAFVGVLRSARYKNGQMIADVARVQEYGSIRAGIPARKVWQPVGKELKNWSGRNLEPEKIIAELKKLSAT